MAMLVPGGSGKTTSTASLGALCEALGGEVVSVVGTGHERVIQQDLDTAQVAAVSTGAG